MSNIFFGITFIFDIFIAIYGIVKRKMCTPYTIFALVWSIIYLFYFIGENHWYPVDFYAAFILMFGNLCFILSSFLFENTRFKKKIVNHFVQNSSLNYRWILILTVITLFWLADGFFERAQMLIDGMTFKDIIIYYSAIDEENNLILSLISILIGRPYTYCSICILVHEILCDGKKRKWVIYSQMLIIIMNIIQNGRRSMLIYFIFVLVIESVRQKKYAQSLKIIRRHKAIVTVICVLGVFLIIWISGRRETNILESISGYLAGGIPSFNMRSQKLDGYFYGTGLIHGLLVPLMLILHGIFHVPYPEWYLRLDYLVESANYISIGPSANMNAFNTMYFIPYIDGNILFVFFEMLLIGGVYGVIYKKLKNTNSLRYSLIYDLLLIGIAGSMYTLYFTQYPYAIAFFYLLFLTKNNKFFIKEAVI